ncbi:MAG: rod shape-determining protein MreC [Candidatus Margulisbacteria bacterium]|nr:rod shape-determining protein MreC [Candidatus Margulisiibacteriota bacterium]MBU1021468.1 rod shape-determining protein MreC [Candidatus Margulisiibacteriota bacterium]MBU1728389.1 rod shape-determining protein MreC [Candidatus Margulisiibacteriota bacterium]MBU1955868.1 rod shape-determining protein MreC [Candidatus Margulisiibacteriota bacterium]
MSRPLLKKLLSWLLILIVFVLFINLPRVRDVYFIARLRSTLVLAVYPFQYAASAISTTVSGSFGRVTTLFGASSENDKLKDQVSQMKAQVLSFETIVQENQDLRRTLGFYRDNPYKLKLLPAQVIAYGGSNLHSTVMINRGTQHGVVKDAAIISAAGLVGKTEEVFKYTSRVLLIIDPASSVSARDAQTKDFGVIEGRGLSPLSMKYVPASSDIKVSDKVITSGMSDIFPPGIPIGEITAAAKKDYDIFQMVKVKPFVNFSKLDQVFVVQGK